MLIEGRFKNYYQNDINPMCIKLWWDSINGKYKNESRWISREDFNKLKDSDPYVAFCWSFGNNLREYLYGKDIEPLKKAWHYAIFFDDYKEIESLFNVDFSSLKDKKTKYEKYLASKKILRESGISNTRLQQLENESRLATLERLQSLQSLQSLTLNYSDIKIKENSVIYCDIPYKDTNAYGKKNKQTFDFEKFYKWCKEQKELVLISSYSMPDDFICVEEFEHRSILCATANLKVKEKIFIPKHQLELWNKSKVQKDLFDSI